MPNVSAEALSLIEAAVNRSEAKGSSRVLVHANRLTGNGVVLWAWVGRTDVAHATAVMTAFGWTLDSEEYDDLGDDDCPKEHRFLYYIKGA